MLRLHRLADDLARATGQLLRERGHVELRYVAVIAVEGFSGDFVGRQQNARCLGDVTIPARIGPS